MLTQNIRHYVLTYTSRKSTPFYLQAEAKCSAKYSFTIKLKPSDKKVLSSIAKYPDTFIRTQMKLTDEIKKSVTKTYLLERLRETSVTEVHHENLLHHVREVSEGNYTGTPTLNVLRKIVSEVERKEQVHDIILQEIALLKEVYELQEDPFVQEIGVSPIFVILYGNSQLQLMKQ